MLLPFLWGGPIVHTVWLNPTAVSSIPFDNNIIFVSSKHMYCEKFISMSRPVFAAIPHHWTRLSRKKQTQLCLFFQLAHSRPVRRGKSRVIFVSRETQRRGEIYIFISPLKTFYPGIKQRHIKPKNPGRVTMHGSSSEFTFPPSPVTSPLDAVATGYPFYLSNDVYCAPTFSFGPNSLQYAANANSVTTQCSNGAEILCDQYYARKPADFLWDIDGGDIDDGDTDLVILGERIHTVFELRETHHLPTLLVRKDLKTNENTFTATKSPPPPDHCKNRNQTIFLWNFYAEFSTAVQNWTKKSTANSPKALKPSDCMQAAGQSITE